MKLFNNVYIRLSHVGIWGLGIGDWGFGIGDWGLGIGPNPQSPIPNPQSPIPPSIIFFPFCILLFFAIIIFCIYSYYNDHLISYFILDVNFSEKRTLFPCYSLSF